MEARRLTIDHDPSVPEERKRIEESGGQIIADSKESLRVNGRLNMTRSIGDLDLKPFGVTAEPDINRRNLKHGKDKFLALLTDGICGSLTDSEIINCVVDCEEPENAASRLVDQALMYSCEDNATALILPLGSWGKPEDNKSSSMFSLGRNMALTSRYN
jgi:protein phosphatase 1K